MRNPFRRQPVEDRAIADVPWIEGGPLRPSLVDQSRALTLAPVYAAVRIIAQDVSTLPIKGYRDLGSTRAPMSSLPQLFGQMVTSGEVTSWLFRCVTSLALRGNAFGLVTSRDGFGFPTALTWLDPGEVTDSSTTGIPHWLWRGRDVPREDMVHIPWFSLPGQTVGLSPIESFATTIGTGLQAQDYGSNWFANGGIPPGTFKNAEKVVAQEDSQRIRSRLTASIQSRQPLVYGADWDYKPIAVSPGESQFLETSRMTANQIAAIYGVRPEKIGGDSGSSLTYATVEQNQLEYATSTLRFWCELLEGAFAALLPERQYVRFNLDAIVRADLMTRWNVHKIRREIGAANIDEIRALEDEEPLPAGEGQDYTPLRTTPAPATGAPAALAVGDSAPTQLNQRWKRPE